MGNYYIADDGNNVIRKVDAAGIITTVPGSAVDPKGLAVDGSNNIYWTGHDLDQIYKVDAVSGAVTLFAGNGSQSFSGDGGAATAAGIANPNDIAFDSAGNAYIADMSNNRIRKVAPGGIITTVVGTGTPGYSGDGGAASGAEISGPFGVFVDGADNLYFSNNNATVRRVDAVTGIITTVVGIGTPGFSGDGGPATAAQLNNPSGIVIDALGDMYIADVANFRVRKVDGATGTITTVAGDGVPWAPLSGDGGPAILASLSLPNDVAVDSAGDLLISDTNHYRIRKVEAVPPPPATVTVSVPSVTATYNQALTIPVSISEASGIIAAEVTVEYDPALLTLVTPQPTGVTSTGTLTDGWSVEYNTVPGAGTLEKVKIALATDVNAITGPATLININFTVNDVRLPSFSDLTLSDMLLNDGTPANVTTDGLVTLVGNDGTIDSSPVQFIPREDLTLTVVDADADVTSGPGNDNVNVTVTNLNNGDVVNATLAEDAATAGTFSVVVPTEFGLAAIADATIQAKAADVIESVFVDALDSNGAGPTNRTDQSTAIGGFDGTAAITQVSQPGDVIYLRVDDTDLNTDDQTAETAQIVVTSSNGESETITLNEVDVDDDVFFGSLNSTSGAVAGTDDDGTINAAKGDVLTATYDDVVTALGDQLDRVDTDQVVDPFGDADGNSLVQAFDAAQTLLHVLSPFLTGLELLQANVDTDPSGTGVTPFDASLILQKRVGLIAVFPVQQAASTNHPQSVASSPKKAVQRRDLVLAYADNYLSVQADERADILSGDVLIAGIDGQVQLGADLDDFIVASRQTEEGLRILFAGAVPVDGPGELLRVYSGVGPHKAQLTQARFNDGTIVAEALQTAGTVQPAGFALHANWPNPFNPETTIAFDLPQAGGVELQIFDVLGQSVRTLVAKSLPAGSHQVVWNGLDESGAKVSSGVYVYRLQAAQQVHLRRMLLLK